MKAFKLALIIIGLMIGISFSMKPLQQKEGEAEKGNIKLKDTQEFARIEEITISFITDLMRESPGKEYDSVPGSSYNGTDNNGEGEGKKQVLILSQSEKKGDGRD